MMGVEMLASDLTKVIEQDHLAVGAFVKGDPEPPEKASIRAAMT